MESCKLYDVTSLCIFRSEKVDFLYKDKVDSEEYLLGKRVDTHFERQNIPQGCEYTSLVMPLRT